MRRQGQPNHKIEWGEDLQPSSGKMNGGRTGLPPDKKISSKGNIGGSTPGQASKVKKGKSESPTRGEKAFNGRSSHPKSGTEEASHPTKGKGKKSRRRKGEKGPSWSGRQNKNGPVRTRYTAQKRSPLLGKGHKKPAHRTNPSQKRPPRQLWKRRAIRKGHLPHQNNPGKRKIRPATKTPTPQKKNELWGREASRERS